MSWPVPGRSLPPATDPDTFIGWNYPQSEINRDVT